MKSRWNASQSTSLADYKNLVVKLTEKATWKTLKSTKIESVLLCRLNTKIMITFNTYLSSMVHFYFPLVLIQVTLVGHQDNFLKHQRMLLEKKCYLIKSTSHYFVSLEPVKGQHYSELLVWHRNISIIAVSDSFKTNKYWENKKTNLSVTKIMWNFFIMISDIIICTKWSLA